MRDPNSGRGVAEDVGAASTRLGRFPVHVLLLPATPALALWAGNRGEVPADSALPIVMASALFGLVISLIVYLPRRHRGFRRAAGIGSLVTVLLTTIGYAFEDTSLALVEVGLAVVAIAAIVVFVDRSRDDTTLTVTALLNVVSMALVIGNVTSIASAHSQRDVLFDEFGQVDATAEPSELPDIWVIIPDRYARADTLLDRFDFDNTAFLDSLEERGFEVIEDAATNYPQTSLALASSFNLEYLEVGDRSASDIGPELLEAIRSHRLGRTFVDAGYDYLHLGSWAEFSSRSHDARVNLTLVDRQEYYLAWETTTILPAVRRLLDLGIAPRNERQIDHALHQFGTLSALAQADPETPTFVLSHLIVPHEPYVFDSDGRILSPSESDSRGEEVNYPAQVQYVNRELTDLIDTLQAKTAPPIIVILSDEGQYPPDFPFDDQDSIDWSQLTDQERVHKLGILAAVYFPPGVDGTPSEYGVTSVNLLRRVVDAALGSDIGPLPDRAFLWSGIGLTDLREVTHLLAD